MEFTAFLLFLLGLGILFGVISSTPLGPINLLVAENFLSAKKIKIIPFLIGVILIDSIFGYFTFWGFETIFSKYDLLGAGIGIFGGLCIILLGAVGLYQLLSKKEGKVKSVAIKKSIFLKSSTASFTKGFILCGSNPGFIAFWGWVAYNAKNWSASIFPEHNITEINLLLFSVGIVLGDFIWFGFFIYLLKKGAKKYSDSLLYKVRLIISLALIILGIYTLYASF